MNKIKIISLFFLVAFLTGCIIYPVQVVSPLDTTVVDAKTGEPIKGAKLLRIVCDLYDLGCKNGIIDRSVTNEKGKLIANGKRQWGVWILGPHGVPSPNHQIAIWKDGYYALIFSQYGNDIEYFKERISNQRVSNKKVLKALSEIPKERKYLMSEIYYNLDLNGGKVPLHKLDENK